MNDTALLKELRKGIIAWYDFKQGASVLYIGDQGDAIVEYLRSCSGEAYDVAGEQIGKNLSITVTTTEHAADVDFVLKFENSFDYVVCIGVIETIEDPGKYICSLKAVTKDNCVFLLGMNNRMGIRYFCGDRDIYTGRNYDGIEGYRRAYNNKSDVFCGRMYDKYEIKDMLVKSGADNVKFYSVLSDLQNPILLFADGYKPKEDLATRIYPVYNSPETVFLEEETLYKTLVDNDMFHQMANAYLVEFSFDPERKLSDALQITSSMVRGSDNSMLTVIHDDNTVEKINVYPEGRRRFENMLKYAEELKGRGLKVLDMQLTDRGIVMPYVDAPVGQLYLKELFLSDRETFFREMDHFRELILQSSDTVGESLGEEYGVTLKHGYPDMVPLNTFFIDGEFVFFDQEFREDNYPANAIIARMVSTFYAGNFDLQKFMTRDEMYARYNLIEHISDWRKMEWRFLSALRNDGDLQEYYKCVRRNSAIVNSNRQSMNYSADDYYRIFIDIFNNADTRKLIIFGSGKFAKRFTELYSVDYPVYAVIDNNESKWGQEFCGVEIKSPELLSELGRGEYKVIICIKNYTSVMNQLKSMGVAEFSVYDPDKKYPRRRHPIALDVAKEIYDAPKKYHVGYIAGVFDLYHVGHLNMFKKAKEYCDYLIVGVVSDEGAEKYKKVKPFVPFEERIEMVRSCRYVDEAVEIPLDLNDTKDAFAMYHFDVQFSGSDYVFNQTWLNKQKYLRENGSDLVFFPYTKSTSSTSIKALIEKGLAD